MEEEYMIEPVFPIEDETITDAKNIFISYSHSDDERWLEEIGITLGGLQYDRNFTYWDDRQISEGENWNSAIESALTMSNIAIFLVNRNFLASEYSRHKEMPQLLENIQARGGKVFVIFTTKCHISTLNPFYKYQAFNTDNSPLSTASQEQIDDIMDKLAAATEKALSV